MLQFLRTYNRSVGLDEFKYRKQIKTQNKFAPYTLYWTEEFLLSQQAIHSTVYLYETQIRNFLSTLSHYHTITTTYSEEFFLFCVSLLQGAIQQFFVGWNELMHNIEEILSKRVSLFLFIQSDLVQYVNERMWYIYFSENSKKKLTNFDLVHIFIEKKNEVVWSTNVFGIHWTPHIEATRIKLQRTQ